MPSAELPDGLDPPGQRLGTKRFSLPRTAHGACLLLREKTAVRGHTRQVLSGRKSGILGTVQAEGLHRGDATAQEEP